MSQAAATAPPWERRVIYGAKGELTYHLRHEALLGRWPILPESWAEALEQARLDAVDRTPGPATFGR
jgi:hypothetical protein